MAPGVLLLGVYVVYLAYSITFIPDGHEDPVYRLSGVSRTGQLLYAASIFLCGYGALGALLALRHLRREDLRAQRFGLTALSALIFLNVLAASFPDRKSTRLNSSH